MDLLEIHTKHTLKKFQPGNKGKNKSKVDQRTDQKILTFLPYDFAVFHCLFLFQRWTCQVVV